MSEVRDNAAFNEGVQSFNSGNLEDAIQKLRSVTELDPSNTQAHAYLGAAYSRLGRHDAAVAAFAQLTKLEPTNPSHFFNLGRAYEAWGKPDQAQASYQQAVQLKPDYQKAKEALDAINTKVGQAAAPAASAPTMQQSTPSDPPSSTPWATQDPQQTTPWASQGPQTAVGQSAYTPGGPAYGQPSRYGPPPVTYSRDVVPPEIAGKLCWGGFLLAPFWSIAHSTWIGLLAFVPYVGWIMSFVLLFKGNEWGWKNRSFSSVDEFRAVQSAWTKWGIIILILSVVLGLIIGVLAVILGAMAGMEQMNNPGIPPAPPKF